MKLTSIYNNKKKISKKQKKKSFHPIDRQQTRSAKIIIKSMKTGFSSHFIEWNEKKTKQETGQKKERG